VAGCCLGVAVPDAVPGMLGTELALGRLRDGETGADSTESKLFWGVSARSRSPKKKNQNQKFQKIFREFVFSKSLAGDRERTNST
jgi:hypothetical protein